MKKEKKALICPLNWGLGHATRVVPVIKALLENDIEVVVASYDNSGGFLKNEFPQLKHINFPGYSVRYSKRKSQLLPMLFLAPSILYWSIKEHRILKRIVFNENIDVVISDHRFGCWARSTYNIFITHQLKVIFPKYIKFLEPAYRFLSELFIKKYDDCWIPDYKDDKNLSGTLSHGKTRLTNICYIGPLSRFDKKENDEPVQDIDILFLLSGPEPQRTLLEDIIYDQTMGLHAKMVMVRGSIDQPKKQFNFPAYDLLNTKELYDLLMRTKLVVCRSGYSSIMDLVTLRQKAVLIPTPGQTEQEYLAQYLHKQNIFYTMPQQKFNLVYAIRHAFDYPKNMFRAGNELIEKVQDLRKTKLPK